MDESTETKHNTKRSKLFSIYLIFCILMSFSNSVTYVLYTNLLSSTMQKSSPFDMYLVAILNLLITISCVGIWKWKIQSLYSYFGIILLTNLYLSYLTDNVSSFIVGLFFILIMYLFTHNKLKWFN